MALQPAGEPETRKLDFLWLEVTAKCNLRCLHCYADSGPGAPLAQRMGYQEWRRTLLEAFAQRCRKVQFIGGEPALYPRLPDLIADAGRIGYQFIEVFTNGTRLSDSLLETFQRWGVRLAFSFYAAGPELHERMTARPGSFARTVSGIRKALEKGLAVRVGIIAAALNSGDIEATRGFLGGLGVKSVGVDRVRGVGRGAALSPTPNPWQELCGACWRGKLCINPRGDVFPCVFSRFCKVGHASEGLASILQGQKLNAFRGRMRREQSGAVPTRLDDSRWVARQALSAPMAGPGIGTARSGAGRTASDSPAQPLAGCEPESTSPECPPAKYCSPELGSDYCYPDYDQERCGPVAGRDCYPNTPCHP